MMYLLCLSLLQFSLGDVYLHMPRGSNNRLDEANRDRANANRLFDSQNNNRGGYNVGSTYYTQGSTLYSQWTNQHSCGAENNDCELIIQYMCDPWLRDGTTTNRIPENDQDCYEEECDTDLEYGRFESQTWYEKCKGRERNQGLFTSNQALTTNDATRTRQNPNGNRYAYECAEERDYYPYWYPTPWVDVAILTNEPLRCPAYQAASENVLGRWYCDVPEGQLREKDDEGVRGWIPLDEPNCLALPAYIVPETNEVQGSQWIQSTPHNAPAPACRQNVWSRDNHLGSGTNGYMNMFNWTMPTDWTDEQCAFRLRYNITTSEYAAWASADSIEAGVDHTMNADVADPDDYPDKNPIWEDYAMTYEEVEESFNQDNADNDGSREYVMKNNPDVDIFGDILTTTPGEAKLQLNINTNQFGRTFQDRSHRFALRAASEECAGVVTHNLQVRGKRGNVVQTYPGMEYDFVPEHLKVAVDECVHIQWTGSNTNPNNNAGQGRQGTDRHNIVELRPPNYDENQNVPEVGNNGQFGNSFPADVTETAFLGFSDEDENRLAVNAENAMGGELSELDDAGVYFDLKPKKVTREGIYHYLCTRNNNFSNRSQKGKIDVTAVAAAFATIGAEGGELAASNGAMIVIESAALESATTITLETQSADSTEFGQKLKSDYIIVYMDEQVTFTLSVPFSKFSLYGNKVMWNPNHSIRDMDDEGWERISGSNVEYDGTTAHITTDSEGVYVVHRYNLSLGWGITITVLSLLMAVGLLYLVNYFTAFAPWLPRSIIKSSK